MYGYRWGVRVTRARLAVAAVPADENRDIDDIRQLAAEIGLTHVDEAIALVASFYPNAQLQPKVQFGLEEIFSQIANNSGSKP